MTIAVLTNNTFPTSPHTKHSWCPEAAGASVGELSCSRLQKWGLRLRFANEASSSLSPTRCPQIKPCLVTCIRRVLRKKNKIIRGLLHCSVFPSIRKKTLKPAKRDWVFFNIFLTFFSSSPILLSAIIVLPASTGRLAGEYLLSNFLWFGFSPGQAGVSLSPSTSSVKMVFPTFLFLIQKKPGAPGPPGHPGKAGAPVSKKSPRVPSAVGCCLARLPLGQLACPQSLPRPWAAPKSICLWRAVIKALGIGFQRSLMVPLSASHRKAGDG